MMRSMYAGVSGLKVHQTKMDVIGNNIANVNTMGFKSQRVTFSDVFSQTVQSGTGANDETGRGGRNPMQIGLGSNISSIDTLMTTGSAQRTDNPFDLMVGGDGFIIVGDATGKYFTRAGALRQDEDGNLVTSTGMKVQGWPSNEDGSEIVRGPVQDIKLNSDSLTNTAPETTKGVSLSGNLNKDDSPIATQVKMYDSLGNMYTLNAELVYTGVTGVDADAVSNWTYKLPTTMAQLAPPPAAKEPAIILVDKAGNKLALPQPAGAPTITVTPDGATGGNLQFDNSGRMVSDGKLIIDGINLLNGVNPETGIAAGINAKIGDNGALVSDLSKLTQYSSKTSIDSSTVNGGPAGQMTGYDMGADGKILAHYSNGATRLLGQVVVAEFTNPAGLSKAGDNLFTETANSGEFDGIGSAGDFQTGVLEMSNVDLSKEFTEMIIAQRGFQANSKIIGTSDEMLQELVNIKR